VESFVDAGDRSWPEGEEFKGHDDGAIFRLANGQVWQQRRYRYRYKYKYRPRVRLYQNQSRWFMEFDCMNEPMEVVRANILEDGVIVSEFNGFDGSSRFGFASGCVWEQAEYTTPIDPMRSSLTA
jgi:hypothetical protein